MTFQSVSPIQFGTKSLVTTSLGKNDPELGALHHDEDGRLYQFVYNDGGASVPVGCGVVVAAGTTTGASITVTAATSADLVTRHLRPRPTAGSWCVV
jgi:hypothetical protein